MRPFKLIAVAPLQVYCSFVADTIVKKSHTAIQKESCW